VAIIPVVQGAYSYSYNVSAHGTYVFQVYDPTTQIYSQAVTVTPSSSSNNLIYYAIAAIIIIIIIIIAAIWAAMHRRKPQPKKK
jgi:cytochrome c-type biogenesis protein CcmH/NrfF